LETEESFTVEVEKPLEEIKQELETLEEQVSLTIGRRVLLDISFLAHRDYRTGNPYPRG
jgi:tetrahydromethanopterin S-methyltransferase subunit G